MRKRPRFEDIKIEKLSMKMIFFQQKDCDIHNQRPFFIIYKKKITKKWQIPLRLSFYPRVKQNENENCFYHLCLTNSKQAKRQNFAKSAKVVLWTR